MPFSELHLPPQLQKAVHEQGYTAPTQIQKKAIPLILQKKDIIGHSETGSGKTAAFGLPLLSMISHGKGIQGLILTPTRELCLQVSEALRGFSKYLPVRIVSVFGGVGIGPQLGALRTADVVVATPGRLLDVMSRGVKLTSVSYVVLDEADRMLDMGFIDDVEKILRSTPKQRQTLLFSATLSPKLRSLVHSYMNAPVSIQAETQVDTRLLSERAYIVPQQDKFSLLVHFLRNETKGIALVFCKTRHSCDRIARNLRNQKINATEIHGGLSQNKRTFTITNLHKRGTGVLVATDVASRGLHISNVSNVYNYELPQTPDDYVHRIGRTARAGAKGDAITLVTQQDSRSFGGMLRTLGRHLSPSTLPAFEKVAVLAPAPNSGHERHLGSFHSSPAKKNFKQFRRWKR